MYHPNWAFLKTAVNLQLFHNSALSNFPAFCFLKEGGEKLLDSKNAHSNILALKTYYVWMAIPFFLSWVACNSFHIYGIVLGIEYSWDFWIQIQPDCIPLKQNSVAWRVYWRIPWVSLITYVVTLEGALYFFISHLSLIFPVYYKIPSFAGFIMWLFSNTVVSFHSQVEPPMCESWEPGAFWWISLFTTEQSDRDRPWRCLTVWPTGEMTITDGVCWCHLHNLIPVPRGRTCLSLCSSSVRNLWFPFRNMHV